MQLIPPISLYTPCVHIFIIPEVVEGIIITNLNSHKVFMSEKGHMYSGVDPGFSEGGSESEVGLEGRS